MSALDARPGLRHLTRETLRALRARLAEDPQDPRVLAWAEKLLRLCELRRGQLEGRCRRPGESAREGRLKLLEACEFFLEVFAQHSDPRYPNLVLKLLDLRWLTQGRRRHALTGRDPEAARSLARVRDGVAQALQVLRDPAWRTTQRFSASQLVEPTPELPLRDVFADGERPGAVVFSPSPYSLHTLAVLELLRVHGVRVQGVAVRRLLNPKRLRHELGRDGARLVRKVWKKLVLRRHAYPTRGYPTLADVVAELGVTQGTVPAWARDHGVPLWPCATLNDPVVLEGLRTHRPRVVLFTGGGLLRSPILDAAGAGVINPHMGFLPPYRGMDVVEWPVLEGWGDEVGLCVHFMVPGLDQGDLLVMHRAPREGTHDFVQLRERMEALMPHASVGAALRVLRGELEPTPQVLEHGRQYFVMHPRLQQLAQERYRRLLEG